MKGKPREKRSPVHLPSLALTAVSALSIVAVAYLALSPVWARGKTSVLTTVSATPDSKPLEASPREAPPGKAPSGQASPREAPPGKAPSGQASPKEASPKKASPKEAPSREVPPLESPSSAPRASLRVATWNVRDCAAWDPAAQARVPLHDNVARTVKEARADIIVLEEVQSDEVKGGDIALLSVALAREGWAMPYVAVINAKGEDDLAIFSRYKILGYRAVLEPGQADAWPRPGIFATIDIGGVFVDVYGFHFKAMGDLASEKARRAQAKALGRYLVDTYGDELTSKAVIVAGDFNTANASDLQGADSTLGALRLAEDGDPSNDFLDANYRFRRETSTFRNSRYSSILDHILLSPALAAGFEARGVNVLAPSPGQGKIPTSDHNLVIVEVLPPG